MRTRWILAALVLAACSSKPAKEPAPAAPEPTESQREIESLLAEGAQLEAAGDHKGAAERFKSAVVIDPKNAKAQYDLAVALENARDWKGSAEAFERVLALDAKLVLAHVHLAEVKLALGDRAAARRELETATTLEPKDAQSWLDLARVEIEDGHPEAAVRRLEKAVGILDEPEVWYHLGLARELAKDSKGAVVAFEHAVKADPKHARALNELALLRAESRDTDGAIAYWRQAVVADPKLAPAQKNLGIALYKDRGEGYRALGHFEAYVALGGPDPQVKDWIREIKESVKTFRSLDRASAVFDRIEGGELVTADQRFPLRDAKVGEKAKAIAKGDRIRIFFENATSSKVADVQPAK